MDVKVMAIFLDIMLPQNTLNSRKNREKGAKIFEKSLEKISDP